MSMTAQYPPHPLAKRLPRKQTPRKVAWRMAAEPFDPSKVARLSGTDRTSVRVSGRVVAL